MDVYQRIDMILQDRKVSRRKLAENADIPPTTLQSALARKKNLTIDMIQKIATALDVSINELLGGDGDFGWENKAKTLDQLSTNLTKQFDALTPDEKIQISSALDVALEHIQRIHPEQERDAAIQRLGDIIAGFGNMVANAHDMRFSSSERPNAYLVFLRHYEKAANALHDHKKALMQAALDWLEDNTKLRALIYGDASAKDERAADQKKFRGKKEGDQP